MDSFFFNSWTLGLMGGTIGLILGSFLSVLIPRLHKEETGIWLGRSMCPHCKTPLSAQELIPVLSFCFQKGRCQHCQKKIPPFHPLLELGSALLFAAMWIHTGDPFEALLLTPIFLTVAYVVASDLLFQEVHDAMLLPGILYAGILAIIYHQIEAALWGAAWAGAFFGVQYGISKGKWVGSGDILIGIFMGLWLTEWQIHWALLSSYILGSGIGIGLILLRKAHAKTAVPLGPFLMAGSLFVYFS